MPLVALSSVNAVPTTNQYGTGVLVLIHWKAVLIAALDRAVWEERNQERDSRDYMQKKVR